MSRAHVWLSVLLAGCVVEPGGGRTPGQGPDDGGGPGGDGGGPVDGGDDGAPDPSEGEVEQPDPGEGVGEGEGEASPTPQAGEGEGEPAPDPGPVAEGEGEADPGPEGCAEGLTACGDGCADLQTDPDHCGECFQACADGFECAEGGCLEICRRDEVRCGADCVVLDNDVAHCGRCDRACEAGQDCDRGECVVGCEPGLRRCGERCVDQQIDANHCGGCGAACAEGRWCVQGVCQVDTCRDGRVSGEESDVDCGGPTCPACLEGADCRDGADCEEGVCGAGVCQPPRCDDGVRNGAERGVDCGDAAGACDPGCAAGEECGPAGDAGCASLNCLNGVCLEATCDDGILNGAEADVDCGAGGDCPACPTGFRVLERREIVYRDIDYMLLKVELADEESVTENWCRDYEALCQGLGPGWRPTGCGTNFAGRGGYGVCMDEYGSYVTDDSLGCNPSGGIANAARQAGFDDADGTNSFGFHSCGGSCQRVMCRGDHCNSALSYIDLDKPHGYTLCRIAWCDNGEHDAERGETGPDCGGEECERRCAVGEGCEDGTDCASGICSEDGLCVAPNCEDGIWNGDEEGIDCNGGCPDVCPTCEDDEANGLEADVDCGGPDCEPCADGSICEEGVDCASGVCEEEECQAPACDDGVRNGDEDGLDCGNAECGPCPNQFEVMEQAEITYREVDFLALKVRLRSDRSSADNWCFEYEDLCLSFGEHYRPTGCGGPWRDRGGYGTCFSEYGSFADDEVLGCNPSGAVSNAARQAGWNDANGTNSFGFHSCGGTCQKTMCRGNHCNTALSYIDMGQPHGYTLCRIDRCGDGERGQEETDVDCGGPDCAPCPAEAACQEAADCEHGVCEEGVCAAPTCEDGVRNGGEEGIDCNGPCQAVCPTCVDEAHNGLESDVDCGGPECEPCADGGGCAEGADCASGVCADGVCQAPRCDDGVRNGDEPLPDCGNAECGECPNQFEVLEEREVVYQNIPYLALRVRLRGNLSSTENWCREYEELCAEYDRRPTGCGVRFADIGGYAHCMDEYNSFVTDDSLGCNPSGGVRQAATQAGYEGATGQNSFGFHSCGGSCRREMCEGDHCNTALSYIDMSKEFGFTLCR